MRRFSALALTGALLGFLMAGCDQGHDSATTSSSQRSSGTNQIYGGALPCEDCDSMETELALNFSTDSAGGVYTLTETPQGGPSDGETQQRKGNWKVISGNAVPGGGTVYVLHPARGDEEHEPVYLLMENNTTLKLVDDSFQPLDTGHDDELHRL
ncbi:NlpE N-terminal domain-containing protein [Kushneria avicenniae]|uniref:NlpE N-terminal domain-containing protein n=1 Tax=Kushneria avicenniae TaxID=402385 RepID=A0A1I1GHF6_9GAMM|nr:copper resistance protein NlpE N-terminal domain-containing protein [Kushneria avicenniae]SFC10961.1 NlpE N-terminal domain-containing protein [Kushneria avicenniae]